MSQLTIAAIACVDSNYGIGYQNALPWQFPADLKHFRETTKGHSVLMGRKTYESIGKPLPGRRNIVLSRAETPIQGVDVYSHAWKAIQSLKLGEKLFVIGGGQIYDEMLLFCNRLIITHLDGKYATDTSLPDRMIGAIKTWPSTLIKECGISRSPGEIYAQIREYRNPYYEH